jgi:hypothetical protein
LEPANKSPVDTGCKTVRLQRSSCLVRKACNRLRMQHQRQDLMFQPGTLNMTNFPAPPQGYNSQHYKVHNWRRWTRQRQGKCQQDTSYKKMHQGQ